MAKQLIVSVMEDVVGEYILNISKENIKIAALRGKIKLDNVQLDGDLIGSHVLGAVGLSGFGVLSCWARSLKIIVPLKNLEKEPTRFEIHGLHLVCVPLLPSTANKLYGAGTNVDPRCTLRTRAKRSALARFERNYFAGRIPDEGPPSRRVQKVATEAEQFLRKSKRRSTGSIHMENHESLEIETTGDDSASDWAEDSFYSDSEEKNSKVEGMPAALRIPIVQHNWKTKLREKMLRNMEASIRDIHIRCEVSEKGLDFCHPNHVQRQRTKGRKKDKGVSADQRAFCFGMTLDSFIVRTANASWEIGSELGNESASMSSKRKGSGSSFRPKGTGSNKVVEFNNMSVYWDDEPTLLICDSHVLQSNDHNLTPNKIQALIATAMEAMTLTQDPGEDIRQSLSAPESSSPSTTMDSDTQATDLQHDYCCESLSVKIQMTLSDRDQPGPMTCFAEFLPFHMSLYLAPHQFLQYQKLRSAMLSQQRFDTMLHQRPKEDPKKNPRAWWKYAIACVMTRPTSRPWTDVIRIATRRNRYIALVTRKILHSSEGNGFHAGLNETESCELLALEDLLPIEALLAFHLLALRDVYEAQKKADAEKEQKLRPGRQSFAVSSSKQHSRSHSNTGLSRFRMALVGGRTKRRSETLPAESMDAMLASISLNDECADANSITRATLLQAVSKRLAKKPWHNTFQLNDAKLAINLLDSSMQSTKLRLEIRTGGTARSFGPGKRDVLFDIMQFDLIDCRHFVVGSPSHFFADGKILTVEESHVMARRDSLPHTTVDNYWHDDESNLDEERTSSSLKSNIGKAPHASVTDNSMKLTIGDLPKGVVCRVVSAKDLVSLKLSVSAHPATLVWNKSSIEALSDFFASPSTELQTELTRQLRNVATPLARKAQLALLSPTAVLLNVDIAAPKLWLPISSESDDGAAYLDAGRFKLTCSKEERGMDTQWEITTRDIQVMFVRHQSHSPRGRSNPGRQESDVAGVFSSEELPIIRPFHVRVNASMTERTYQRSWTKAKSVVLEGDAIGHGPTRRTEIRVSPICLNLLDAEILARAIGKWYANGIILAQRRASTVEHQNLKRPNAFSYSTTPEKEHVMSSVEFTKVAAIPHFVSVTVDKVEIALEGHSKSISIPSDEHSLGSLVSIDASFGSALKKRTYVVEVFDIRVTRVTDRERTRTSLTVMDATIVQLKDESSKFYSQSTVQTEDSVYHILVRDRGQGEKTGSSETFAFQPLQQVSNGNRSKSGNVSTSMTSKSRLRLAAGRNFPPASNNSVQDIRRPSILTASFLHDGIQHIDEVEIEIDSVIVRVTPTSLKDCSKGLRRVFELIQLMTKEMERKIHEEGRSARQKGRQDPHISDKLRAISPVASDMDADEFLTEPEDPKKLSDSSILFKVTMRESTLLAGRPVQADAVSSTRAHAVVQVISRSLIMFQSIENPDASGNKTLHISLDNLSASVNSEFERVAATDIPPMIGPTAAEIRVVYATENLGCVVSQDISVDCETIEACLAPNDILVLRIVSRKMLERLRSFGIQRDDAHQLNPDLSQTKALRKSKSIGSSLIRYQHKGAGIATRVRIEMQRFSFVLLRTHRAKDGTRPLFDLNVKDCKGRLEGCISALSGEFNAILSANFFNSEITDWEYVMEPLEIILAIDQMPNELILQLSTPDAIQLNLTSLLLKDLAEMEFKIFRIEKQEMSGTSRDEHQNDVLTPSTMSSVGLRRATESRSVTLVNLSGVDLQICPMESMLRHGVGATRYTTVESGSRVWLDSTFGIGELQKRTGLQANESTTACLRLAPSAIALLGEREPVINLALATTLGHSTTLHRLQPTSLQYAGSNSGRNTPETSASEASSVNESNYAYYTAEPVVEWCMQNQRLRSSTVDMYSLEKGQDLLSSSIWSPEDESYDEYESSLHQGHEPPLALNSWDDREAEGAHRVPSPGRKIKMSTTSHLSHKSNWVRPYLKNDSPEWTDMTCILRMARERVMLPDNNWIWLNDWTVDLSGSYGETTDADGWEYEADFETFSRTRRFYIRGDSCRRRRWTRTRIVRPPRLDDPYRQLLIVWETKQDDSGNETINIRSALSIRNCTAMPLAFFAYNPSWNDDIYLGDGNVGDILHVPVSLSSAIYLRLGMRCKPGGDAALITNYAVSRRVMILPTSYNSSVLVRTSIQLADVVAESPPKAASETNLHFLVHVKCTKGVVDIFVEPVLRIINLLPCQLQCALGEVIRSSDTTVADRSRPVIGGRGKRIALRDELIVPTSDEGKSTSVNPASKPHVSLRVPGYQWSPWQRIVNRKANSCTWQPSDVEEEWLFASNRGDVDYVEEFKSIVRFERIGNAGDPLVLIVSVEVGNCPTIRVYAQYWVLDKTGFGCRFCEGFIDLLGTCPDGETSRRSHLLPEEAKDVLIQNDAAIPGHQWSIGMNGMSLFFSRKEKISLSIESGTGDEYCANGSNGMRSKWVTPMDISNVMPKTVFSVDEYGGPRRFELAMSVTVCPTIFARTKLITFYPRYQIVNLLGRDIVVAQDGCLKSAVVIHSQSSVPFHRDRQSLPPKVRLGAPSASEIQDESFGECWTNGCIQLDKVGITSMRLPTQRSQGWQPMVIQAEVRLATKDQSSAVVVVIWSTTAKSNPLYVIRNQTSRTILCRQPLQDEAGESNDHPDSSMMLDACSGGRRGVNKDVIKQNGGFECGSEFGPIISAFLGLDRIEEFVWILKEGEVTCFGFDDPEKPHILEWTCVKRDARHFDERSKKAFLEIDAMGSSSGLTFSDGTEVRCHIIAEHSTKVIEFFERQKDNRNSARQVAIARGLSKLKERGKQYQTMLESTREQTDAYDGQLDSSDDEDVAFSLRMDFPTICISVIDNATPMVSGREILLAQLDKLMFEFSQNREGYHELELTLTSLQVDNHVHKSIHPVLIFCPKSDDSEPLLHMSAVRRLQYHSSTFVFRYAAVRVLEIEIFLDRRTAETIARFVEPLSKAREVNSEDPRHWATRVTLDMATRFAKPNRRAPREMEHIVHTANSGRIYFEQLHLHPVRLALTFTQEWMEWNPGAENMMIFQFIRGMASIANAPLTFTSFVVGHAFESPQALLRIVSTHYSSQLTKQIFGIIGSLAILGAPADFISNVGTGVRDFFYEPINGMVHGPAQFIEGLEAGTQSLARGVFVGVVRGAANVTEVVNANLAGLTADDTFIDERKAHQRMLTDAMSRGVASRTMRDSLYLAGASVARGVKSGAMGIMEQPAMYASKHGPVGFVKGIGKALVGAIVKPVVGVGDAAVLVMNHVSEATSDKQIIPKIPKRLRRALPRLSSEKPHYVQLTPYDDRAAKAQKIVTGGESVDDVYIGHVNIPSHLIIASEQCLWAIDRRSREPWCVSWEEISHFGFLESSTMRITVFSQTGLRSYVFEVGDSVEFAELHALLTMQLGKMGNGSSSLTGLDGSVFSGGHGRTSKYHIPGIKAKQVSHVFGSCNRTRKRLSSNIKDEIDVIEQCFARVKSIGSDSPTFFQTLDEEAWALVNSWGQVFSGLSSRRCIAASIINGTGNDLQIKSTKLVEGGSPCYSIPTKEFDAEQGILRPGGAIIFFGWGVVPNLLQAGNVFMNIEANAFVCDLSDHKSRYTSVEALSGYQVGFLEKSYDESGWWAKYWLLVRKV